MPSAPSSSSEALLSMLNIVSRCAGACPMLLTQPVRDAADVLLF